MAFNLYYKIPIEGYTKAETCKDAAARGLRPLTGPSSFFYFICDVPKISADSTRVAKLQIFILKKILSGT